MGDRTDGCTAGSARARALLLQAPDFLSAAWSPDGRTILMNAPGETLEHEPMGMLLVDADTGEGAAGSGRGWAPFAAWQPVR